MKADFFKDLLSLQNEIGAISKDATNPFFKSKYFDINSLLAEVKPVLAKHNFIILQPIMDNVVKSVLVHSSGERLESGVQLPQLSDPQKIGSAITYFRRYSLQSLLALEAEDDDANLACGNTTKQSQENKPWLNLITKDNQPTALYASIQKRIASGEELTLSAFREHYKVSKSTVETLAGLGIK